MGKGEICRISPDGILLLVSDREEYLKLFDLLKKRQVKSSFTDVLRAQSFYSESQVQRVPEVTAMCFTVDSEFFYTADADGNILLIDVKNLLIPQT